MGNFEASNLQGSVVLGVLVGLVATSVQSLGLTLQRKSHILEDEKDPRELKRPPHRRRRWQLGMLMFLVSNIVGSSIQITTLPLPVLSTLQASGLVFNSICATLILGEPFTRWSFGGTILVCGGAILIAIFGAITEPAHTLDQLLALLGRRQFVMWMVGQAILVTSIIGGAKALKHMNPRNSNSPRMRLVRGMAYGCISGILSAHSLLMAKSAVELLVRTIVDRQNQFNRWESWAILLSLLGLALTQLYYLHRGLKLCSTSILYPFCFCVYNIIAIMDGLIYFHQTSLLSLSSALLITLGTVILLIGVLALSWRLNADPTRPPVGPKTPLTPGLGFIDSTSPSSLSPSLQTSLRSDNDNNNSRGHAPPQSFFSPRAANTSFPDDLHTPIAKESDLPTINRLRRKGITESQEIWEELEDSSSLPPLSPFSYRRASTRSTPRGDGGGGGGAYDTNDDDDDDFPNESTALLGAPERSNTIRTYRTRRRRSAPVAGRDRDERERDRERSRSGTGPGNAQAATGGWWKMRWWGDGKSKGEGGGGGGGGGGGEEGRGGGEGEDQHQ